MRAYPLGSTVEWAVLCFNLKSLSYFSRLFVKTLADACARSLSGVVEQFDEQRDADAQGPG